MTIHLCRILAESGAKVEAVREARAVDNFNPQAATDKMDGIMVQEVVAQGLDTQANLEAVETGKTVQRY